MKFLSLPTAATFLCHAIELAKTHTMRHVRSIPGALSSIVTYQKMVIINGKYESAVSASVADTRLELRSDINLDYESTTSSAACFQSVKAASRHSYGSGSRKKSMSHGFDPVHRNEANDGETFVMTIAEPLPLASPVCTIIVC